MPFASATTALGLILSTQTRQAEALTVCNSPSGMEVKVAHLLSLLSWKHIHHTKVTVGNRNRFLLPSACGIRAEANCGPLGSHGRDGTVECFITGNPGDGFRMFGQNVQPPHLRSIWIEKFVSYYTYSNYIRPAARLYTYPGHR